MQWLDGHDLASALSAGPLSPADSMRILVGAADAMATVHGRGIVHRDFKPSNLFLSCAGSTGDVVLLDFGVSRRLNASTLLTGTQRQRSASSSASSLASPSRESRARRCGPPAPITGS
jgi:serine/threonine protein kinase